MIAVGLNLSRLSPDSSGNGSFRTISPLLMLNLKSQPFQRFPRSLSMPGKEGGHKASVSVAWLHLRLLGKGSENRVYLD